MEPSYLQKNWKILTQHLSDQKEVFYTEITKQYTGKKRFYHTLQHVEALLKYVDMHEDKLDQPDVLRFAIWYHDVIYNASKKNNEEESAKLAVKHLSQLEINPIEITLIHDLIVATKSHELSEKLNFFDAQFLIDIDLSILSTEWEMYQTYTQQIRKEYNMYPFFLYKKGRKQVLQHFLEMDHIYKTDLFREKWETRAKENMKRELVEMG